LSSTREVRKLKNFAWCSMMRSIASVDPDVALSR
jgi:hypothetical protein